MKSRTISLLILLLIICLITTACSSNQSYESKGENAEKTDIIPGAVKMYSYKISGQTFQLKTRIEDYITPDRYFHFDDLANDLGWREIVYTNNGMVDSSLVRMIDAEPDPIFVEFYSIAGCPDSIRFGTIRDTDKYPFNSKRDFYVRNMIPSYLNSELRYNNMPDNVYLMHNGEFTCMVYLSQIVIAVYVMENYPDNPDALIFDNILERFNDVSWAIYE